MCQCVLKAKRQHIKDQLNYTLKSEERRIILPGEWVLKGPLELQSEESFQDLKPHSI